jgi:hypothetical protein
MNVQPVLQVRVSGILKMNALSFASEVAVGLPPCSQFIPTVPDYGWVSIWSPFCSRPEIVRVNVALV